MVPSTGVRPWSMASGPGRRQRQCCRACSASAISWYRSVRCVEHNSRRVRRPRICVLQRLQGRPGCARRSADAASTAPASPVPASVMDQAPPARHCDGGEADAAERKMGCRIAIELDPHIERIRWIGQRPGSVAERSWPRDSCAWTTALRCEASPTPLGAEWGMCAQCFLSRHPPTQSNKAL